MVQIAWRIVDGRPKLERIGIEYVPMFFGSVLYMLMLPLLPNSISSSQVLSTNRHISPSPSLSYPQSHS